MAAEMRSPTPEKLELPAYKRRRSMRRCQVIGLTGPNGAGKGSCAEYLSRRGFQHMLVGNFLAELVKDKGLEPNRPNMLALANALRAQWGPAVLVRRLCEQAQKLGHKYVIDSVRTVAEADAIEAAGGMLLAVDADEQLRYKRMLARKSAKDHITYEQFKDHEEQEWHSDDCAKPSLLAVIKRSHHLVENGGSHKELHQHLDAIFGRPARVCLIGPHGTGKTTLLHTIKQKLQSSGVRVEVCEELARPLISEMGLTQQDFTEFTDPVIQFQHRLLDIYLECHRSASEAGRLLLSDRCALDQLAYLDWQVKKGRGCEGALAKAWAQADDGDVRDLYADAHLFLLRPDAGLCRDDGTRMRSNMDDLLELYESFKRVLRTLGLGFRSFSALHDDPDVIVELFFPQA